MNLQSNVGFPLLQLTIKAFASASSIPFEIEINVRDSEEILIEIKNSKSLREFFDNSTGSGENATSTKAQQSLDILYIP